VVERGSGGEAPLSVAALRKEPTGRTPLLGTLKDMKKRLWKWASLSIQLPLGNQEDDSPAGDSERWMKGALGMEHLSLKRITVECLEGGPLLGTLEDMLTFWHWNYSFNFSTPCI